MTAYILTPAQHSQLVDALNIGIAKHYDLAEDARVGNALAMLKALKPVELYGWGASNGIVGDCVGPNDRNRDETEYTLPLYPMETKT